MLKNNNANCVGSVSHNGAHLTFVKSTRGQWKKSSDQDRIHRNRYRTDTTFLRALQPRITIRPF
jgi:hypothetical protein